MRLPLKLAHSLFSPKGTLVECFRTLPPTIIFHCFLGCRKTWDNIAQILANASQQQVYTVDVCNHGESPSSDKCGLLDMAMDVEHFLNCQNINKCHLLGHSMGGRVAMILALQKPSLVQTLTVVDVSPMQQPPQMVSLFKTWLDIMRNAVSSLPKEMNITDARAAVQKKLNSAQFDESFCTVLLDTMIKRGDSFSWMTNLDVLETEFDRQILRFPDMSPLSYSGPTFFMGSERPVYIKLKDHTGIYNLFPKAEISYMPGTKHHVAFDRPEEFLKEVMKFRKRFSYLSYS